MRLSLKLTVSLLALALLLVPILTACGGDEKEDAFVDPPPTETPDVPKLSIVIGNLTDITGVSANAMEVINKALDDVVDYANENDLIPGVELKVITYDNQFDPSRDIPGYEWLLSRGADLIWTCVPPTPVMLKARVDADQIPLYAAAVPIDELSPPGYVFCIGIIPQQEVYTFLPWIAENDWDYVANGPAKIGGAGWPDTYCPNIFDAMDAYAEAHPEQFEFVGGHLNNYGFTWDSEVQALRDADYVYPNTIMVSFVKQYRNDGGKAKFVGTDPLLAFRGMVDDAELWDEMDGSLFIRSSRWWNEEGMLVDLANELVRENHGDADKIIRNGCGYLAVNNAYQLVECIGKAVELAGGPENFNSDFLYEATQQMSIVIDGTPRYSFTEGKRTAVDSLGIYRMDAEGKDLFRADPEWLPVRYEP